MGRRWVGIGSPVMLLIALTAPSAAANTITVTTTQDEVSRWLEVRVPRSSHRLNILAALHEAKIPTFAFVGPREWSWHFREVSVP